MTYEEAIKALNLFVATKTTQRPVFADVAINALNKQIPRGPRVEVEAENDHDRTYKYYYCPDCGKILNPDTKPYYCKCGQKLDWSDEE